MNKSEQGNTMVFLLIILVIVSGLGFFFFSMNKPATTTTTVPNAMTNINILDINRDEKVDQTDLTFITSNINCKSTDPCWNKVIGKTSDGDNPIYVFDLDLNKDNVIDQNDVKMMPSGWTQ